MTPAGHAALTPPADRITPAPSRRSSDPLHFAGRKQINFLPILKNKDVRACASLRFNGKRKSAAGAINLNSKNK
jgi:hypothetical protein